MKSFLLALQFLTVAPIRIKKIRPEHMPRAVVYFPIIGLLLGLVLCVVNYLLVSAQFDPLASNIIIVVLLIAITGALHLDGLSDTFDGLFSGKDRLETLKIMRDPHVGSMGVLALVSILLLKISFLSMIRPETKNAALLLMCVLSRWSMALSLFSFPYARKEGKAKIFADGMNKKIFITLTIIAIVITFIISRIVGPAVLALTAAFAYLANLWIKKKIGGVTGDTIGAISEFSEIVVLFSIVILERVVV